jgi:hypothetical protein
MMSDDPATARRNLLVAVATGDPPPESLVAAFNRATGQTLPLSNDGQCEVDVWERERLEEFRSRYWDLPPAERRAEWQMLQTTLRMPHSTRLLNRWKLALDRTTEPRESPDELFILNPRTRGLRRIETLQSEIPAPATVKALLAADPDLVLLDPVYFSNWSRDMGWKVIRGVFPADLAKRFRDLPLEQTPFVRVNNPEKYFIEQGMPRVEAIPELPQRATRALNQFESWTQHKAKVQTEDRNDRWKYISAFLMVVAVLGGILRMTSWSGPTDRSSNISLRKYAPTNEASKRTQDETK